MIRVLIVDDSRVVREVLKDMLKDTGIEVVGEAADGKQGIEMAQALKPNLITMDVIMPIMDGLAAVEHIMAYNPTPILVFASSVNRKDVNIAFEAIQLGALDVMEKPDNLSADGFRELRDTFVQKIRLLSNIKVIRHIRGRRKSKFAEVEKVPSKPGAPRSGIELVAIGASTGGPKAVMSILKSLPANFPVGTLLVQHIGVNFTQGFVEWLDKDCAIKVKMAEHNEKITPGKVIVAPGDVHMETVENRVILINGPVVNNCRPSVDVLFSAVARSHGENALAVLLTGMGRDGADGMLEIKKRKGKTIVQDESSSVIFGMPRAAIESGAADQIMHLKDIPGEIVRKVGGGNGEDTNS